MQKRLALVTCLYDLVKRGRAEHRTVDWLSVRNDYVLSLDRELVIFTEPELEAGFLKRRGARPTKIVTVPFEELLGTDRCRAAQRGAFQRNAQKVRTAPIYIQLMWSKYAMLEEALKITDASHLAWIDVAIAYVAKPPPQGVDVFADPSDRVRVHVLRNFRKQDVDHQDYWLHVQGHLAGGLVEGSRAHMHALIDDIWRAIDRAASMELAPLDEELLSYVVGQRVDDFTYSYGDYEDILRNHDEQRAGEANCRWIAEDARRRGLPDMMKMISPSLKERFPEIRTFRPTFSPRSCYLLQDQEEETYFSRTGDGAPEAPLIAWATQFIAPGQTFVDVGAHIGSWAQHFAQACKQVHAFEPQRSTYERLVEGLRLAELTNVICHDAALGAQGTMDLHVAPYGGWSTLRHRSEIPAAIAVEQVRCMQLDDFNFGEVGVIKIDAEGYEIDILRGAAKTLEKHRPTLLLEAWDHDWYAKERSELITHVVDLGYGVVPIQGWPQMLLVEPRPKRRPRPSAPSTADTKPNGAADEANDGKKAAVTEATALIQAFQATASLAPDRPLLGLVMIVKNEAKRIATVLKSFTPFVDYWTVLDTNSSDGTQDIIRDVMAGIPGVLHEEPFVDFATSRNRALELHGTSTVFSIMPNGDVLEGGADLVSFLAAHRRDLAGAYRVRISPGHYYHPLVMRTGFGWHYKWRTHECAMGPNVGPQIPGVTVVRDRGSRTGDEWRLRWERDLVLLNQDREADPSDPRPYFYLGQTHECLGQHAEALPFFERRAEMGGYFDEVYEAKFRIAKMKHKIGHPWAEVQQAYLEAFAHDPRRAEPLYEISQYWYDKKIHAVSRLFAVTAAKMPKPLTDLFLDEDVYTWKAADRAAISSFYSGHKADGRNFAEQAVSYWPNDERLRSNRAFCSQSASDLFGFQARDIEFTAETGWSASNPSICVHEDRLRCIVRTVNYKLTDGNYVTSDGIIRTRNFLLDLDDKFKTLGIVEMVDRTGDERSAFPVRGFEDARLFSWNNQWWASATVRDFTDHGRPEIALLQIDADGSIVRAEPLRGPWSVHIQKNWMPIVTSNTAKFIYATSLDGDVGTTMIFDLVETADPGASPRYSVQPPAAATYGHGRLRGGSQAVRVDGGWIFVVHDVAFPGGSGRIYLHRFVFIDDKLQLVSMTDPFYFEKLGIEFCAGLAQVGDKLVASYAVNDGSARLGVFDWKAVRQALRKDFVI